MASGVLPLQRVKCSAFKEPVNKLPFQALDAFFQAGSTSLQRSCCIEHLNTFSFKQQPRSFPKGVITGSSALPTKNTKTSKQPLKTTRKQGIRGLLIDSAAALPLEEKLSESKGSPRTNGVITHKRTKENGVGQNGQSKENEAEGAKAEGNAVDNESQDEIASMHTERGEELFEFVKNFVNESVGRRTVGPQVVQAVRKAGLVLRKGELPELLRRHPETFKYNPANQYIQLVRERDMEEQTAEELGFEERERQFINFLTALLQERPMPEDGLFFSWVSQLARHPSSGLSLTGLPRLTRMIAKHLDLFKVEGFGTTLLRVSSTEQGRLRVVPDLPREFRLYLRSAEAQLYRDGIWTDKPERLEKKQEQEEKVKALTEEELKVVLVLMRAAYAKGPGGSYRLHEAGSPIRDLGLKVRGKPPKLSNIAFRSQDVFEVRNWGTPYVEISLTQEGWEAAEKLQHVDLLSAPKEEGHKRTEGERGGEERKIANDVPD